MTIDERNIEDRFQALHQRLIKCEDMRARVVRLEDQNDRHLELLRVYAEGVRHADTQSITRS